MIDSNLPEMVFRRANHILVAHPLHLSETVRTNMRDHRGSQQQHLNRLSQFGSVKADYKQNRSNLTTIISAKRVSAHPQPKTVSGGDRTKSAQATGKGGMRLSMLFGEVLSQNQTTTSPSVSRLHYFPEDPGVWRIIMFPHVLHRTLFQRSYHFHAAGRTIPLEDLPQVVWNG
ncbi:hypothetical protein BDV38DRAFT_137719 [Aspergillus pseudotamarii]|uniref:Uncharacterized protein n=1 Tax=Aspergillus pseudotamarii TaxID=132259 RepID=A0A5N6SLX7_ASPPS|nr:uncharacterized protein BDV38DRAFT_137719 [Aspergillus pseudotamarii]KAE8135565.1 hypothetical protein BDV38DRAFT_137719 [Aspergillus pseudotamarii]